MLKEKSYYHDSDISYIARLNYIRIQHLVIVTLIILRHKSNPNVQQADFKKLGPIKNPLRMFTKAKLN